MSEERSETESPEAQERAIREETANMDSTADRMDERLDELGGDIQDAKRAAAQRQDAPDEPPVAGDWEGEAAGADQGDDAMDTGEMDAGDDATDTAEMDGGDDTAEMDGGDDTAEMDGGDDAAADRAADAS